MSKTCLALSEREFTQRKHQRSALALPAIVKVGGQEYGARILNIAAEGAMIQCSAYFRPGASFFLRCGSITAESVIVWGENGRYGINFRLPLTERQLMEQLSRSKALDFRKRSKGPSGSPINRVFKTAHNMPETKGMTPWTAHLSAVEASQTQVNSCMSALETFLAGELSDLGQFSAARLRLRQANVNRTRVALEACRYLMKIDPTLTGLSNLQRLELDTSQMISEHVQYWPLQKIKADWKGYCGATGKVLTGVRELITAERRLLCRMLQEEPLQSQRS